MFRTSGRRWRKSFSRADSRRVAPGLETLEPRRLLAAQSYVVDVTDDSNAAGTLRSAILAANQDTDPSPFDILFNMPASNAANLSVPVAGFDPVTQTWQITLKSPLPTITHAISIDGFSQANDAIPFRYSDELVSAVQTLAVLGTPTGGSFTLTTAAPLPVGTTASLPIGATEAQVQAALEAIVGVGNVAVSGGNLPQDTLSITFEGAYVGEPIPTLVADASLSGGSTPSVDVESQTEGSLADPSLITSAPNTIASIDGDNAQVRVILDGSQTGGSTGLVLDASQSVIRGLAIEGFGIGIAIPNPSDVGDLIQGNFIGPYLAYPVDQGTGNALPSPDNVTLAGEGNTQEGLLLGSANATVGGFNPDENNVISGNGAQGVLLMPGASGNQVLGNQIGVIGPSTNGLYFQDGNGADGVWIQSSGTAGDPTSIVYSSSNVIGGAVAGSGNVISVNGGYGVHLSGVGATRNLVEANYIGVGPGGGFVFGTGNPGNSADGVRIDDAPDNQVGGLASSDGNVISSNQGAGVYVTGADAAGNAIENNIIGLNAAGSAGTGAAALGNDQAGVADYSPGTLIGPGNVISANLLGILISGASATGVIVRDNLIGTDSSGTADLGNAQDGIQIVNSSGNTIEGDNLGVQVISGNLVGIEIDGATSTQNLIEGNLIGTDESGTADRGNSNEGILIEGAFGNTVGGTTAAARNVISANQWGIRIDGPTATGNLIEGNYVGTDLGGNAALGNEINGIILSDNASDNTIGGTGGGQGNSIAYNVQAGVLVQSGTGDSILSNSIVFNGQQGIALDSGNDLQSAPTLSGASGGGTGSNVEGSLTSVPDTSFLIQFFSSLIPDPSGVGQGQTFLGSTVVTTLAGGTASINFNVASGLAIGTWMTVTATNESNGDSSGFSNAVSAQPVSISFASAAPSVQSTDGMASIEVERSGNLAVAVSINYATSNGSAVAGQDYTAAAGILTFAPNQTDEFFSIPILVNSSRPTTFSTVNLTLSQPAGGATLGSIALATLTIINDATSTPLTFVVTNTDDSGLGSLRNAITAANNDPNPGVDNIVFEIPASTAGNQNIPVPGFDPINQVWTITLASPLPVITHPVTIDGFTQASTPVDYRYPNQVTSAVQDMTIGGGPTGGTFSLSTLAPLPVGTTPPIAYSATPEQVEQALVAILGTDNLGTDNVSVTEPTPGTMAIAFQGDDADLAIPNLVVVNDLTGGSAPSILIQTATVGGIPIGNPTVIASVPNTTTAIDGNDAQIRVIVDGSQTGGSTGLVIATSQSIIRGLAIEGFGVGISIPGPTDVGDLIQGDAIGEYLVYPVDSQTGLALPAPDTVELAGVGNTQEGILLGSANATVGGIEPQDANVIGGNGAQGVLIVPGASGNQVLGNQIGVIGPSSSGLYFQDGNGSDGVAIESSGTAGDPSNIVYSSSNVIGGAAPGSGNIISANHGYGVHLLGVGATRNLVEANSIGGAPEGGYVFGNGRPGNSADGVRIDDAPDNQVGGLTAADGNVISSNQGAGVYVTGADAMGNTIENDIIGLTATGTAVLGNNGAGVATYSPGTLIGPGNVISANLLGILISGASATGVIVRDNLVGTDSTGSADLGNAQYGIEIDSASGNTIGGDTAAAQVISGNLVGIEINGGTSTQNLIQGNLIGTDKSGTADLGNSNEGILIEGAHGNTVGGTTSAARNVISANQWGIRVDGSTAALNLIEGNYVGTDINGTAELGNEINGIIVSNNASNNTIGGTAAGQGNTIAYNVAAGVSIESGTGDSILSNSIFSNGHLGIDLVAVGDPADGVTPNGPGVRVGPDDLQNYPVVTAVVAGTKGAVQASFFSLPNTPFLIQFFSNTTADPSGYGQGQTLLGSQSISTDATGMAVVSLTPQDGVPANTWVSATATNEFTGDTSEFAQDLSAQPVSVQFEMMQFAVDSSAGVATIEVVRVGNVSALVTVQYATSNGTAIAGKQYLPASGALTFLPGQAHSEQTFPVTILPNESQSAVTTTVNLALSQPADGATLGTISTATLSISELPAPPPPPPDLVAPKLTSEQLISNGLSITAIVLDFSKPLVPGRAQNLGNYGYFVFSTGANGVFGSSGGSYVSLSSAVYTEASQSVTLTPSVPLSLDTFWRITIDGQTSTLLNNGLTDAANNLLIGSGGTTGTPLLVTFAAGKRLKYTDSSRNVVSLHLTKGGLMALFQSPAGNVQQLQLFGTIARKTTLSGSVSRSRGGTGRTILPPIAGVAGVRVRLKTPPFVFRAASLVADAELSELGWGSAGRTASMTFRPLIRLLRPH
jgi:Calx-beta domain